MGFLTLSYLDGNVNVSTNDVNVQMQLKDVLQFITGADCIPPSGFDHKILIRFYDQEGDTRYPYASTCALQLLLPRGHEDETSFSKMMIESIFGSYGFGKA